MKYFIRLPCYWHAKFNIFPLRNSPDMKTSIKRTFYKFKRYFMLRVQWNNAIFVHPKKIVFSETRARENNKSISSQTWDAYQTLGDGEEEIFFLLFFVKRLMNFLPKKWIDPQVKSQLFFVFLTHTKYWRILFYVKT